jgi:hypothetical protein
MDHARAEERSALAYARTLLADCGSIDARPELAESIAADEEWARSGAMALTGLADGPPRLAPGPLALCARGALAALHALAPATRALPSDAPALLGERAAIAGLARRGRIAPGGSCRLAVNLARRDDDALLAAWLEDEREAGDDPWQFAQSRVARRRVVELVDRGRLMGLPIAAAAAHPDGDGCAQTWMRCERVGTPVGGAPHRRLRVLDLSSLWAGPLCTSLLQAAGAEVIKLESPRRPDGARGGPSAFFDLLNAGKRAVAVELLEPSGRGVLRSLIDRADVVVESARPRALAQLGIDARRCVAERRGLTWLGITGHGRREPQAAWVAFGDDAAVAAGAASRTGEAHERPLFCGDAIADPLTGLHAAVAVLAAHRAGGGVVLDVALRDVTAHALAWPQHEASVARRVHAVAARPHGEPVDFVLGEGDRAVAVAAPRARRATGRAAELGADTGVVLDELGIRG